MSSVLRQSTAVTLKFGPFLDETDGKTAETSLTISQADVRLSKNGANIAQKNESTSATHDELGFYDVPLDTTDTNTLGRLLVAVHESGALPVWHEYTVISADDYDALVGTGNLKVDVVSISGDSTAADNLEADYDGTGYDKSNSTIGTTTANTDMRGTDNAATAAALTTHDGKLDTVDGIVDAILVDTAEIGAAGAGLTAIPNVAGIAGTINTLDELDTAQDTQHAATLTRLGTPAGADIATDIAANQTDLNSILARLLTLQPTKNATFSNFEFLMVLASDSKTPATGLTVTGQRSIDGGAFASVSGTITEVSNGIYQFDAVAADTNGDLITWRFSAATADDTFVTFKTVS